MAIKLPTSYLKPEGSIMAGIATAALAAGIYTLNVGNIAQVHATQANDPNLMASRKKASIESVGIIAAVALLAKDTTIFILGGATVILLDWHVRHAVASHPQTGQMVDMNGYAPAQDAQPQQLQGPAATVDASGISYG